MAFITVRAVFLEFFLRECKRLSQKRIAELCDISRPYLNKILKQKENKEIQPHHLDDFIRGRGILASQLFAQLSDLAEQMERTVGKKRRVGPSPDNAGSKH